MSGVPFKITYYCGERRKHFVRTVTVDDDLEVMRKLNGSILATITMSDERAADGKRKALMMRKVNGQFVAVSGQPTSVPEFLFGPTYLRAKRTDPSNLWDLRREAFTPLKKEIAGLHC
jgi:hypothetical protein